MQAKVQCCNYENCPAEIKSVMGEVVEIFKDVLRDNLVGVYLHGSLAMGCFNPKYSDIDLLVVAKNKLPHETKRKVIDSILRITQTRKLPKKEIEFSIILKKYLDNFEYLTPFELHYSITHKEKYVVDPAYMCENDKDPDLAAHIMVVVKRGICLYGKPISDVFKPIPEKYYLRSILYDVEDWCTEDPVYRILNLCRVLYYLKEKVISSKDEGGTWALENTLAKYKKLVRSAIVAYRGFAGKIRWNEKELSEFYHYMMKQIDELK